VLVTNDDGPGTGGLAALVRAAAAGPDRDVVVAVPARDASSTGTALDPVDGTPIEAWPGRGNWPGATVSAAYEVSGYPSTIVTLAALGGFGSPPDLVLAGVNRGVNVGRGVVHSSTVGAALTAAVHRIPAVAFSAAGPATDWAAWHDTLVGMIGALPVPWPAGAVLNVNLPERPAGPDPAGDPVWCGIAEATAVGEVSRTVLDDGRLSFGIRYRPLPDHPPEATDCGAVLRGRIALSWLTLPYVSPVDSAAREELTRRLAGYRPVAELAGEAGR
jgi:5'-nucleotidase